MAIEPKFRPSLTAKELYLIEMCVSEMSNCANLPIEDVLALKKLQKTINLFNFKIGNSYTQPSYVPTGTAPKKVSIEDLLTEDEIVASLTGGKKVDYSSTTAMHTAYKNVRMAQSLGAQGSPEDQAAATKWEKYCEENNLNPETGMDK